MLAAGPSVKSPRGDPGDGTNREGRHEGRRTGDTMTLDVELTIEHTHKCIAFWSSGRFGHDRAYFLNPNEGDRKQCQQKLKKLEHSESMGECDKKYAKYSDGMGTETKV